VQATDVAIFRDDAFFLIAGPCVLEDDALNLGIAEQLAKLAEKIPGGIVYKASFDKANRSNVNAHRGPGLQEGLRALERVKKASGLKVLTDVHLPEQCAVVAQVADVLQIPAFLCRQTDLLEAAGATGKAVNVKKGQWMHPEGMRGAVEKVRDSTSGARHAKGDRRMSLPATRDFMRMREACGVPVVFDATHSVQRPGQGSGGSSGGAREFIPALSLSAIAAGADGLFLETHPRPDEAPSDGPNMLPLHQLSPLIDRILAVWNATRT
jgi:2-dehydro-3-deoxyphosphooctonate aldolase (KDO 8-P synthase)